ncbi:MAG: SDR family oxidoreductase [Alphaproteobacteria bacterium]|nr:SDR family oxidoreductase [Alphaproteobacteria bacterium]
MRGARGSGPGPWRGRRAVVTGGASGIGAALVDALVARGARVVVLDVAEDTAARAEAAGALGLRCDVSEAVQVEAAAARVIAALGGVELLINNAGVSVAGPFDEVPAEDFDWLWRINVMGVVHGCRAFLPHLGPGAHIVNTCSAFAWLGFPGKTAYSASKAAVRAFSEALRAELAPRGVGVTLLFPGPVDTAILRQGRATDPAQREAEVAFLARRSVPPERVAARCLRAVERNQTRVLVSLDYLMLDILARLSPSLALWLVTRLSRRMPF